MRSRQTNSVYPRCDVGVVLIARISQTVLKVADRCSMSDRWLIILPSRIRQIRLRAAWYMDL